MFAMVDGLTFQGDGSAATYMLGKNGIVGWFEGVGVRNQRVPRPVANGEFDSPGYLTGRLITLQGTVLTDSEAAYEAAIEALGDIPADVLSEFTVTTGSGTKAAMVRRVDKPDVDFKVWGSVAEFRVSLFAPDPELYVP